MIRRRRRAPADRPPATGCAECHHAEQDALDRVLCILSVLWSGRCPHGPPLISMAALLGGPTWYEQHRDRWVRTGERAELARMLRHVEAAR